MSSPVLTAAQMGEVGEANAFCWLRALSSTAFAMLLALKPLTAIFVLGWLVRLMQRETAIEVVRDRGGLDRRSAVNRLGANTKLSPLAVWTGWLAASTKRTSWAGKRFGGLIETVSAGLTASLALLLVTLPFTALWLFGWWAGWENSFNKGYEQAWVGPSLVLAGIAIALFILAHLPMALAHFAAEGRLSAIFELSTIRAAVREQRWRNLWLAFLAVVAALPIAAAQALPVFIENWWPNFANMPPDIIEATATRWHVVPTIYLIVVLIFLRRAQARCYARAALALPSERTPFVHFVASQTASAGTRKINKHTRFGAIVSTLFLLVLWLAFAAQIYIAQFANHAWWNWFNHPMIGLPWVFRVL